MLKVTSKFSTTINIDNEDVRLLIKRFTPQEAVAFSVQFAKLGAAGDTTPEAEAMEFVTSAFKTFVEVEEGQVYLDGSQKSITSGEEFAGLFAGRNAVMIEVLSLIALENKLSASDKLAFYAKRNAGKESSAPTVN